MGKNVRSEGKSTTNNKFKKMSRYIQVGSYQSGNGTSIESNGNLSLKSSGFKSRVFKEVADGGKQKWESDIPPMKSLIGFKWRFIAFESWIAVAITCHVGEGWKIKNSGFYLQVRDVSVMKGNQLSRLCRCIYIVDLLQWKGTLQKTTCIRCQENKIECEYKFRLLREIRTAVSTIGKKSCYKTPEIWDID